MSCGIQTMVIWVLEWSTLWSTINMYQNNLPVSKLVFTNQVCRTSMVWAYFGDMFELLIHLYMIGKYFPRYNPYWWFAWPKSTYFHKIWVECGQFKYLAYAVFDSYMVNKLCVLWICKLILESENQLNSHTNGHTLVYRLMIHLIKLSLIFINHTLHAIRSTYLVSFLTYAW